MAKAKSSKTPERKPSQFRDKPAANSRKPEVTAKKKLKRDDEEDYDNDDDFDELADHEDDVIEDASYAAKIEAREASQKKTSKRKKLSLHAKGSGSLFIPKKK